MPSLPRVSSLVLDVFGEEDFDDSDTGEGPRSLKRFIHLAGASIHPLRFVRSDSKYFPLAWDFLHPFRGLRNSLFHLTFGAQLYETVVSDFGNSDMHPTARLDFGIFPRPQSISFSIPEGESSTGWEVWSIFLTQSFDYPLQPTLRTLTFFLHSGFCPNAVFSPSSLDGLAEKVDFGIDVITCGGFNVSTFSMTAQAFRIDLPSWDGAGKLKILLRD
ncbi:hypothetical protein DL96DRAFT_1720351 [Flagelloscypha sp. PMI_526]|nr:hypothetical protein DL96DRAFT_1720351 [Flagelloscypha sp. PMI_526]